MFSPDGRWMSYSSNESGAREVYVRPYPGPGGKWRISTAGGHLSRWSRNGRQLFYTTAEGRIMVSDYEVKGDTFVAGKPRPWNDVRISSNLGTAYFDLAPDGRILTSVSPTDTPERKESVHVTFLLNFFDELKRRAP